MSSNTDAQAELAKTLTARLYGNSGGSTRLSSASPNMNGEMMEVSKSMGGSLKPVMRVQTGGSGKLKPSKSMGAVPLHKGLLQTSSPLSKSLSAKSLNTENSIKKSLLQPLTITKSALSAFSSSPSSMRAISRSVKFGTLENNKKPEETVPHTSPSTFESFTESLQLDERYMEEFLSGNFLYLRPKSTIAHFQGQSWGAYDLTPVEHYETDPLNYYTMSRSGVTHFQGSESEFTPLDAWEREYYLFNLMRKISFFDKYPRWKAFVVWKRHIRQKKRGASSEALQKSLFLLDADLRGSMLELINLCFNCKVECKLIEVDPGKTYSIEQFSGIQTKKRHLAIAWLANFSEDVRALIRRACDAVLDKFLEKNNISADRKMTFMERASLRTECRRLTKYIRLADFVVVDTLIELAFDGARIMLENINSAHNIPKRIRIEEDEEVEANYGNDKRYVPLFRVEIGFEKEDELMIITPGIQDFQSCLNKIISQAVDVIATPEKLLTHEDLSPYTQAAIDDNDEVTSEEKDIISIVLNDIKFKTILNEIATDFESAFGSAMDYSAVFHPYRDIYIANEKSVETVLESYKDASLETITENIKKYAGQHSVLDKIPRTSDIGILRVDSIELKRRMLPSPDRCLLAIKDLLPQLISSHSAKLIGSMRDLDAIVSKSTATVEEFVKKIEYLEKSQKLIPQFREDCALIASYAKLMEDQSWNIDDKVKANIAIGGDLLMGLEENVRISEARLEEDSASFVAKIEKKVPELKKSIAALKDAICDPMVDDEKRDSEEVLAFLSEKEGELEKLRKEAESFQHNQTMLKQPQTDFELLTEAKLDLNLKMRLWMGLKDWNNLTQGWKEALFTDIDTNDIQDKVTMYNKLISAASRGLPGNMVVPKLRFMVEDFKTLLPVIMHLRVKSLEKRHWDEIESIVHGFSKSKIYSLKELLELNIMSHEPDIAVVAGKAIQEQVLGELLDTKVLQVWKVLEFIVLPYKESKDVFILGSPDDIMTTLDDSLVTVNTILGSRFCTPIRKEVEGWQVKLNSISETLDEWLQCQRQWMYLETIFGASDIQKQLPEESKDFQMVDGGWKEIMKFTSENPLVVIAGMQKNLKKKLIGYNEKLEKIQKNLEQWLETKCAAFPRFYFLSNDELLEILAQTKNVQAVQPHLRKCFEELVFLDFGSDPHSIDISAMVSSGRERVPFSKQLKARGAVEEWLSAVLKEMKSTLGKLVKHGVADYETKDRTQWIMSHPGQVVATGAQIMWTKITEEKLLSKNPVQAMQAWHKQNIEQLVQMTAMVRMKLTKLQRQVVVALVTTDVHARDIIQTLHEEKVDSITNFSWQMQLRYYWNYDRDDVDVRQSNCVLEYGHEYQGCASRLVITPLTDRCWMTITGAFHLRLGAAPAGPAGTGKTESSKDLAKATAIFCIVFNCSDQIDYQMLGKLFSGLAQSSSWTCLDEFNRIEIEVLSVVAQQMHTLQLGMLAKDPTQEFHFEGRKIKILHHIVIITMNPGYAGRTALPDNLKVFFRSVSMMVPDYALIAEIMLFAEGFDDSKSLSRKMVRLYKLASEQLSQQCHYDYGLRAVKSVLVMAGGLKRANPDTSEDIVLIRAMRDSNVPKFLSQDLPLFYAIIVDLFPGVVVPYNDTGALQKAVEVEIALRQLQPQPKFITKVLQMFETFQVRFGAVMVGPTGGGKTTIYNVLAGAMTTLREQKHKNEDFQKVFTTVLNPKCIAMGELYGEFNELTLEWTDGLASTIMRAAVADETENKKWTVFDGPIDALWIENMNTVLDDNQTLCLANGERIKLKSQMKMLFEVEDLEVASPATVSRLGVVYVTSLDLGWLPFVETWLMQQFVNTPKPIVAYISDYFTKTLENGIQWQRAHCIEPVKTVPIQIAQTICKFIIALKISINYDIDKATEADAMAFIDLCFSFSYIWAVGGSISNNSWPDFDDHVKNVFNNLNFGNMTVFDARPDFTTKKYANWKDIVPKYVYNREVPYFQLVVPTVDTVRYNYILDVQISCKNSIFMTGVTGTGKTVVIQDFLNKSKLEVENGGKNILPIVINFSAQTNSKSTQLNIEAKLEKKKKTLLGGPGTKHVIIFIDDINMPSVEQYGAQPPIELLRQFQDFKGFYDREKLFWKDIENTVIISSAAPPGGGRNDITKRFSRHSHVLCLPPASDIVLETIFGSILTGFLSIFPPEVKALDGGTIRCTIEVYNEIRKELRPTPAKSHYTFNLRDISKVLQGCLMVRPKEVAVPESWVRLWVHECQRIFYDRLINEDDRNWLTNFMATLLNKHFHGKGTWNKDDMFVDHPVIFVDFLKPRIDNGAGQSVSIYEENKELSKVVGILDGCLEDYNVSYPTQMKLVFFEQAVQHITRIARILRQPRGNAMLVGVGGSGKQSACRIACFMAEDMKCFQIEITRGYGLIEFHEDIKTMMLKAGVEGKPIAFLFTDNQIVDETFLEDINNVLNTGEIPNLFLSDEISKICDDIRPVVKAMNLPESRDVCWATFVQRVRDMMHIVLCMSPVGDSFRVRCRQFPSLINCCTIDWFTPWPPSALASVAQRLLSEVDLGAAEVQERLSDMCAFVHTSLEATSVKFYEQLRRKTYTTPKSYLDLINLYLSMLSEKRAELNVSIKRLSIGVSKLEETNSIVANLKADLTKLQPILVQKSAETEILIKQVNIDASSAAIIQEKVEKEADLVGKQADEVMKLANEAQAELDLAMPALKKAINALNSLSKQDITEVKSFPKPPPAVQLVMEAVCILLSEKPDWATAKAILSDASFMNRLKEFDKDNIDPKNLKKLQKYISDPVMQVDAVKSVSSAATSLCMWVHAMDVYSRVAKEVEPKKRNLELMNNELAVTQEALQSKKDELKKVLDRVALLRKQCDEAVTTKESLIKESNLTKARLVRAEQLTTGLASEQVRWTASVKTLSKAIDDLVGDVFLSAACISYYGAFTGVYRTEMVQSWVDQIKTTIIPCSEHFSLLHTMGDPVSVREWNIAGLPTDSVSTDNAILVTRGKRWPLMIDPQEQAKKWIKNMESKAGLEVTRLTNPNMLRILEKCIRNGCPLLFEDIGEYLDPALESVLQKAVFKLNGRTLIHLGDSDIDYDANFKLYLTTKMTNPHYLPEVCIKVTVINFTVTLDGLEDQLLGDVVKKEKPEIEKRKITLLLSIAADKKQLSDIEEKILKLLSESEGNILDDEVLIKTLADSKVVSTMIGERLIESEKTEAEINDVRNRYRPVATRGSIIYFVVSDLPLIDPMYQYSLSYFIRLYNLCIDMAEKSDNLEKRLAILMKYLTEVIYSNVSRGLFERHKLIFSVLICIQILRERGEVSTEEWMLLLKGGGLVENKLQNPNKRMLSDASWNTFASMEVILPSIYGGICDDLIRNNAAWSTWAENDNAHNTPLPGIWDKQLNALQKLIIVKFLRDDLLAFSFADYVASNLGKMFVELPPTRMVDVFADTDYKTPVIFILSTGADPTGMLMNLAKSRRYAERLNIIALGQGQGPKAVQLIEKATKTGDWVMLQNCHLGKSFMTELEKIVYNFSNLENGNTIHEDFRLFLTSMPADYFPIPVLQNGVKLTNEPPKGLRANLTRTLASIEGWTDFEVCSKLNEWKKLCFGLTFFHAIVQERRKFGPLGWNIKYEFNDSDLEISIAVLKMFLDEQPTVPWDALSYVTGHINYGGRVTDDWDRRCLMSILAKFFNEKILEDGYTFSRSGIYYAPSAGPLALYQEYVNNLPRDDGPEIFGMHPNANMAFNSSEGSNLIESCLLIQPRQAGGGAGKSMDEIVDELSAEIQDKMPELLKEETAGPNTFVMRGEHMDSLATVLSQEIARFNKIMNVMRLSLIELRKAIKGEVLLDNTLDLMYTCFLINKVPNNWAAAAYPSLKPLGSWIKDLEARIKFMRSWLMGGPPAVFSIPYFFFPQGFMTGVLQNFSRKYHIPIDTLNFSFSITKAAEIADITSSPEDGIYVAGLYIDGARWDREKHEIAESLPGIMYSPGPIIHFLPTVNYIPSPKEYSCPIYKTTPRQGQLSTTGMSTNFVVAVELPTSKHPDFWIMMGAAFVCQLND